MTISPDLEETKKRISSIIDLDYIMFLAHKMYLCVYSRRICSRKRDYLKAQNELINQHKYLFKLGLYSEGIYALTGMNPNRPDRDRPDNVTPDDILKIKKFEDKEALQYVLEKCK